MTSKIDHLESRFMDAAVATCAEVSLLMEAFCARCPGCLELDSRELACRKVDQNALIMHLPRLRASILVMDRCKNETREAVKEEMGVDLRLVSVEPGGEG
jgi:hypothetical protein